MTKHLEKCVFLFYFKQRICKNNSLCNHKNIVLEQIRQLVSNPTMWQTQRLFEICQYNCPQSSFKNLPVGLSVATAGRISSTVSFQGLIIINEWLDSKIHLIILWGCISLTRIMLKYKGKSSYLKALTTLCCMFYVH